MGHIASTMDAVRSLERLGAAEGTTVVAASQTQGRGRAGRTWDSPYSAGLYCSILLRPNVPVASFQPMSIATGLAVCDALDPERQLDLKIKWPNDILAGDLKLGGILITAELSGPIVESAIVGIGVNFTSHADLPAYAVALGELCDRTDVEPIGLLSPIAGALSVRYLAILEGDSNLALFGWRGRLAYRDQLVSIEEGQQQLVGILTGIDPTGSLQLQTPTGPQLVISGDLTRGPRLARRG